MEYILIIILIVVLVGFAFVIYMFNQKMNELKNESATNLLKQDVVALAEGMTTLKDGLKDHLTDRLDQQFSSSYKLIKEVTERLTKLDETNKRVVDVADEMKLLQNVLQNPKQRGVLGEYHLESVLINVLPPAGFAMQYKFKDGETVDAVIYLDKKKLPIDSKFSLENYNRLVDETNKEKRQQLAKLVKLDLKNRIDETSKYIRPSEGTMDFAFMFIPSEALYYDLLVNKVGTAGTSARDLIEYAFRDKKVIIVSPTSFMAYLQTVLHGLRSLQIEEQAKEIQARVIQLSQHLANYDTYMHKLGNSLGTTVNHFNTAHKELKKVDKDIIKISGAAATAVIETNTVDRPHVED